MQVQLEELQAFIGLEAEPPRVSRYPVSETMVRNWVEAHDDHNPVYVDAEAARATGRDSVVTPPAMISTWVMNGYRRWRQVQAARATGEAEDFAYSRLLKILDDAGFTSVVATNVDQRYLHEVRPGDHITCHFTIADIFGPKTTGLGEGWFITLHKRYVDQSERTVAEEDFRILRFRPATDPASKES